MKVPEGQTEAYWRLAQTAALLGKGLEDLAAAARTIDAPDPESIGAEGADWLNIENTGVVVAAWGRYVLDQLPEPSGIVVVERKVHRP